MTAPESTILPAIGPWYPSLKHTNVVVDTVVVVAVVVVAVVVVAVLVVVVVVNVVSSTHKTLPIVFSTKSSSNSESKSVTVNALSQVS